MKSTIRLFRAVETAKKIFSISKGITLSPSMNILRKTIRRGFIFSPEIVANYTEKGLENLITIIETEAGLTPEQMNSSFHKSWKKIKEAKIEQLVLEQIIHYITTYGFEDLGIYDANSVYIPQEKLEIPEINIDEIKLVVIKGYTKEEFKGKLLEMLKSGIALHEDTIRDIIDVALFVELNEKEIETIKNKEVKSALYEYLDLFPEDPIEFLRYAIYRSIGKTLLIKSKSVILEIKSKDNLGVLRLFMDYEKKYGLERLSEIFYRFKPIFLAFKTNQRMRYLINKIRKLAVEYHKPMKKDYLNEITAEIKRGNEIDEAELEENLKKVNTFRKIRLAYALKFRTKDTDSILYRIRNGKGYATDFQFNGKHVAEKILNVVLDSIAKDVEKNVKGKKVFIPEYVKYALPATEKQFTGYFPSGTCISFPRDMIVGIHWKNVGKNRIDLDLSMTSPDGKIGWDGWYSAGSILFSGDLTDAQGEGSSELFHVEKQENSENILFVNYYNYCETIGVPFKIMVAKEKAENFGSNYIVNPNNVMAIVKSKIDQKQKVLGLLVTTDDECKFYFAETYLGNSITSSQTKFVEHSRKYLSDFYRNTIDLNDILYRAGSVIVNDKENCDIDLSVENLEKDTIIRLVTM